jgi:hypothetical protein
MTFEKVMGYVEIMVGRELQQEQADPEGTSWFAEMTEVFEWVYVSCVKRGIGSP